MSDKSEIDDRVRRAFERGREIGYRTCEQHMRLFVQAEAVKEIVNGNVAKAQFFDTLSQELLRSAPKEWVRTKNWPFWINDTRYFSDREPASSRRGYKDAENDPTLPSSKRPPK